MSSETDEEHTSNSSLHIPINQEALKKYNEWIEADCNKLWWDTKEREEELKEDIEANPFYTDDLRKVLHLEPRK